MIIVRVLRPRQDQARFAGPGVTTPDAAPAYVHNEGSRRLRFSGLNHTTFDLRFAGWDAPPSRKTRFWLLARLCQAGFLPAGIQ
jgi:hypothetical protein